MTNDGDLTFRRDECMSIYQLNGHDSFFRWDGWLTGFQHFSLRVFMTSNTSELPIPKQSDVSRLFREDRSTVCFRPYTPPYTAKSDGCDLIMH
jgi:hypothetical protein